MENLNSNIQRGFVRSSRTLRVVLQPAGTTQSIQRVPQAGIRFYIVESDADGFIGIKTDKTQQELFTVGTGKEFDESQGFTAIELENFSANVITLDLFAGFGDYIDRRTTIVGNRLSSILPVIEPKTKAVGNAITSITGGAFILLSGVPDVTQIRRKAITVSNVDPNNALEIRDPANNKILTVFANTSIILPLSEPVRVFNPTGGAISVSIGEIWWMKP